MHKLFTKQHLRGNRAIYHLSVRSTDIHRCPPYERFAPGYWFLLLYVGQDVSQIYFNYFAPVTNKHFFHSYSCNYQSRFCLPCIDSVPVGLLTRLISGRRVTQTAATCAHIVPHRVPSEPILSNIPAVGSFPQKPLWLGIMAARQSV